MVTLGFVSGTLIEYPDLRNRTGGFKDRAAAGKQLAGMMSELAGPPPIVLGIPAGGIPVAVEVARALHCELDVAGASKITLPDNAEVGCGAVAFDGSVEYNAPLIRHVGLSDDTVKQRVQETVDKVRRRMDRLRGDAPFPDLTERTVILVDDGLASGFTLKTAVKAIRRLGPAVLIVAVPTGHAETIARVLPHVKELYCANIRTGWRFAVADAYKNWYDVSEEETAAVLEAFRKRERAKA